MTLGASARIAVLTSALRSDLLFILCFLHAEFGRSSSQIPAIFNPIDRALLGQADGDVVARAGDFQPATEQVTRVRVPVPTRLNLQSSLALDVA